MKDFPHTTQYRGKLGQAYHHLFLVHFAEQRLVEAEEAYRQSLPHLEKLTAEAPDGVGYRRELHLLRRDYALLMAAAGRPRDAEEAYGRATADGKASVTDFADDPRTAIDVASTYRMYAHWLHAAGRRPEAERAFREVLALFEKRPPDSAAACAPWPGSWPRAPSPRSATRAGRSSWPGGPSSWSPRGAETGPPWVRPTTARRLDGRRHRPGEVDRSSATADDGINFFFLAMAHRRLDHGDEARRWHGRAVEWMDKNKPRDAEMLLFRAEASEVLGIEPKTP